MAETLSEAGDTPPTITEELVRLAQTGDSEAIGLVYFGIQPTVERAARRAYEDNSYMVERVAAQALEKILDRGIYGESYTSGNFRGWAHTLTVRQGIDSQREQQRRPTVSMDEGHYRLVAEGLNAVPSAETQALGTYSIIADQIISAFDAAGVPPKYREAFILHHVGGLAYEQIADLLGVARGTIASQISRAKARMLAYYGTEYRNIFDDPTT